MKKYIIASTLLLLAGAVALHPQTAIQGLRLFAEIAAPSSPASGFGSFWFDATSHIFSAKNSSGAVTHTVATSTCSGGTPVVGNINADGTVTCVGAGVPRPSGSQRWAYVVYNGGGTACSTYGVFTFIGIGSGGCTGTISAVTPDASWGPTATFTAATAVDSRAEFGTGSYFRSGRNIYFEFLGAINSIAACGSGTCHRGFFGITDSNGATLTGSDLPTSQAYEGFQYRNQASGNSTWHCIANDGTTTGVDVDSTIAVDGSPQLFQIFNDDTLATTKYYINGTQVCTSGMTERIAAGRNLQGVVSVRNLESPSSTGKAMNFSSLFMASDR